MFSFFACFMSFVLMFLYFISLLFYIAILKKKSFGIFFFYTFPHRKVPFLDLYLKGDQFWLLICKESFFSMLKYGFWTGFRATMYVCSEPLVGDGLRTYSKSTTRWVMWINDFSPTMYTINVFSLFNLLYWFVATYSSPLSSPFSSLFSYFFFPLPHSLDLLK